MTIDALGRTVQVPDAGRLGVDFCLVSDAALVQAIQSIERSFVHIAVLIPCRDEAANVAAVIEAFRTALPSAVLYVYDNCSTDGTAAVARAAGAVVRREPRPGKGVVVQRMFADIEADVYVIIDGDDTYDAAVVPSLVQRLLDENLDMVVGRRVEDGSASYRRGHALGNQFFNWLHRHLFGSTFLDVFSGYRVLSRRFVKSFPATATGFEIEAELTVHAVDVCAPCAEVPTTYRARSDDSASKLRTYRDGIRILARSLLMYKELKPARFFGVFAAVFCLGGLLLALPVVDQYAETGLVPRLPTAVLAVGLELLAALCVGVGVILDSIARRHREIKRLSYLRYSAPARDGAAAEMDTSNAVQG